MAGITEWLDCMPATVTWEAFSNRDDYGKPIYAAGVTYRARVVYKVETLFDDNELETTANGHVWFGPPTADLTSNVPPAATSEDRITLPDGSQPNILTVERFTDEDGNHHTKVYFR